MELLGHKGEHEKSLFDGGYVIQHIYEKDGIIHIEGRQAKGLHQITQRLTITKTGGMIVNGRPKS